MVVARIRVVAMDVVKKVNGEGSEMGQRNTVLKWAVN